MAAETGIHSVYLEHQLSHGRATKKTHGSLIDRLRHKNSQNRSWTDSIKSVRSSVAERRSQTENVEPLGVQKCLDTIQKAMKVISQQTLKERLDLIGRQLGLSTQIQDQKVSLGTDAFHVDVLLGDGGSISSVKLANQGDVVDCPDLKDILKKGDFNEFIEHLQGLQSIYQVTNDEKLKSKAFLALQALEKDLNQLAQFQSSISGVANYIHKCPLGIMLPRLAGKPMKLIYFVSPYDLLDKKSLTAHPLTVEAITDNFLGQSVTVCIEPVPESAAPNKLQTMPLMNVSKTQDGKSLPSFSAVSKINSMMLPASFVLVLPQSIPVSTQLLQKIVSLTNLETHTMTESRSLRSLILETFSNGKIKDTRKLFVSLPDQQHVYFLDGLNGGSQDQQGVMVSRVPFTHPTHVPQILNLLRQQLLFNIVIASCIRPGARKDASNSIVFEVTAVSLQQLTIVFEHPAYDSMITVDIDLTDITNLKCRVACTNSDQVICSDEGISRVFQRCMSIPILLRWLISKGRGQLDKLKEEALAVERERLERALFLKEMQRQAKIQPTNLPTKGRPPPQPPHPPPLHPPPSYSHHHHSSMHLPHGQVGSNGQSSTMPPILADARSIMTGLEEFRNLTSSNSQHTGDGLLMSPDPEAAQNPLLTTLLDEEKLAGAGGGDQADVHDSPMLSRLLDDNTSVATTVIPMNCRPTPTPGAKRPRKRRSQSDFTGPSPKHRFNDNDSGDRLGSLGSSLDMDLSSSLMDPSLPNTHTQHMGSGTPTHGPQGHQHHPPMLNHAANANFSQGSVIDLTEESSLKKLADSVDKHLDSVDKHFKDVKMEPDLSMLLNETEAPSRIPNILQNSPSSSKNENASTSLEGFLKGSGEVGRAKDFDPSDAIVPHNSTTFSKLSSLLMATSDSPSSVLSAPPHKANSSFFSDKLGGDRAFPVAGGKTVSNNALIKDVKPNPASLRKGALRQTASVDLPNDRQITGIFEKFDVSPRQQNLKMEVTNSEIKAQPTEGKVSLKLRVGPLKQQNIVKPVVKACKSIDEGNIVCGKSNNIGTFDFKSDEDDDDTFLHYSDRYVCSSSPTRLQITTTKQKRDSGITPKSDKTKKKDKGSGNTTKRKREKDESKREKKRKKNEHFIQESVYRTVENDGKADFKLKIKVAKKPVSDKSQMYSDGKVQSYEISKQALPSPVEKVKQEIKQEVKEIVPNVGEVSKEKESVNATVTNAGSTALKNPVTTTIKSSGTAHKSSPKHSGKTVHGNSLNNKTDPKLVTKATIRLKPLTMPNSGSTVNISQSGPKAPTTTTSTSSNKSERRGSTSATAPVTDKRTAALSSLLERRGSGSNLIERRSASQSASSTVSTSSSTTTTTTTATSVTTTTTTSANLSLSSILPNAPTGSKIASLPRIPKLSSSSSNTSINRTSSLDPASGTSPTSAGTKSNNSYTMGPAGRPSSSTTSGPGQGGGRAMGSNATPFNYSNRPAASSGGSIRQNFNMNRPSGIANRTGSPMMGSGQQRPLGPRAHNPSGGNGGGNSQKSGPGSANSHKSLGGFTNNSVAKGNIGSSNNNNPNVSQKTFSSGAKTSINSRLGSSNMNTGHKSLSAVGNASGGQRHIGQNAHPNSNPNRNSLGSSNVNRSPNTSSVTKSPGSGKSPNISSTGRSPSLNSSGKSPSITNPNKSPNVNRSPNISSSSSGKSPNINSSNRSPSITSNTSRPLINPSGKTSVTSSHKQSPNVTKALSVNKSSSVSVTKTHSSSSTQQKLGNSISGSIKPSQPKNVSKPIMTQSSTSVSSHSQQSDSSKPAISNPSLNSKLSSSSASTPNSSSSSQSVVETSPMSRSPAQKIPTSLPQSSSPSTTTSSVTAQSTKRSSAESTEFGSSNKGSKVSTVVPEDQNCISSENCSISTSTPTTPMSADGSMSKFSFPSLRGRKNSLSAIVDKLKHNAVGAGPDLSGDPAVGNDSNISNKLSNDLDNSKNVKLDNRVENVIEDSKRTPSPNPTSSAPPLVSAGSLDLKSNHSTGKNASSETVIANLEKHLSDASALGFTSNKEVACDSGPNKKGEGRSENIQQSSMTNQGLDISLSKDVSTFSKGESLPSSPTNSSSLERKHSSKTKDRPALKIPVPQALSSPNQSPSSVSIITSSSPLSSQFQHQQSPSSLKGASPLIVPSVVSGKSQKDLEDRVFKIPSLKQADQEEEVKSGEPAGQSPDTRSVKLDSDINKQSKTTDSKPTVEKRTKSLSSPLSDVSSPEGNGLIIDDEESPRLSSKTPLDKSSSSSSSGSFNTNRLPLSPKAPKEDSNSINQLLEGKSVSPQNSGDSLSITVSPKTHRLAPARSPALAKNLSGASTPKDLDSPCEIDDDLMDEALGFGS